MIQPGNPFQLLDDRTQLEDGERALRPAMLPADDEVAAGRIVAVVGEQDPGTMSEDQVGIFLRKLTNRLNLVVRASFCARLSWTAMQSAEGRAWAQRTVGVLRKVWGGRTWVGAQAQSVLVSVWRTCWQQGRSALDFLSQLLGGTSVALALPP